MNFSSLERLGPYEWLLPKRGRMRVPGRLFASLDLAVGLDELVYKQLENVAGLPGIVGQALAMPDAHSGYGFPIGGVAAFDPDQGGVVCAGGVGFDIACGVRALTTNLDVSELASLKTQLADLLYQRVPAGLGEPGTLRLKGKDLEAMLAGGAVWAVKKGFGEKADLARIEEGGQAAGADPDKVSDHAKERARDQTGTLGSGNHYLEIQVVTDIFDAKAADAYGLRAGQILLAIHCGSRGLGHQVATDYVERMLKHAPKFGLDLPDKELACAPLASQLGKDYLAAMRAGINCALANRQVLTHLARQAFAELFPQVTLSLLYDVAHNTCKAEQHFVNGQKRLVYVHRKGATRSFGPGHPELAGEFRGVGQPVLVGGSMGTSSYILAGTDAAEGVSFSSACHGAGRNLSRKAAQKRFAAKEVLESLERRGIVVRAHGYKGVAEEAPGAYKDIEAVVDCAAQASLASKVARVAPLACIKG
jgi:tRNA-splicing ligase RtcB